MQMSAKVLLLVCSLVLTLIPVASAAAPIEAEPLSDQIPTLSVLGFGTASAVPDSARVQIQIGQETPFGPVGPKFELPDAAGLEEVRDFLVENGVEESTIKVDFLSNNFPVGLLQPGSSLTFAYRDTARLREFLQAFVRETEAEQGPSIQNLQVAYQVDDCGAIEEAAMKAALENARQRATRMAALLEMNLGRAVSVSEEHGTNVAVGASGGCIAVSGLASFGLESVMGSMSPLTNSEEEVEVGILLRATFALEP